MFVLFCLSSIRNTGVDNRVKNCPQKKCTIIKPQKTMEAREERLLCVQNNKLKLARSFSLPGRFPWSFFR